MVVSDPDSMTPVELLRGLAVLAEPPAREHRRLVDVLGLGAPPTAADYSDVFLFQLYPYASVHLGPEGMMGGEAQGRVTGFWRALGYDPPAEPDHLAALTGLYAALAERERDLDGAELRLARRSRFALLHEHLAPWVFHFLDRVIELAPAVYGRWAELLSGALSAEARSIPPDAFDGRALPLHLRAAPALPDPRREGAGAFLSGLLAPVRSGFIVTRADLARVSSGLDVGLRAGERRYALEHLLAQDAAGVLRALADEVRRQGALHERRADWLGMAARFHAERARETGELLEALASDSAVREGQARSTAAR